MAATIASVELEPGEYHRESETYRAQYDQETTSASMAVVASLSDVMNVDPFELDPLAASVDTDALDELLRVRGTTNGTVHISFAFEGYAITVSSDGVVEIVPPGHDRTADLNESVPHK